jgi:hypothetical protein
MTIGEYACKVSLNFGFRHRFGEGRARTGGGQKKEDKRRLQNSLYVVSPADYTIHGYLTAPSWAQRTAQLGLGPFSPTKPTTCFILRRPVTVPWPAWII